MSARPPVVTLAKIRRWVGATYAERGYDYFLEGLVLGIRWRDGRLAGRVQGREEAPYRVNIEFAGAELYGACSCPVGFNCKHVAAALYAYMDTPPPARRTGPPLTERLARLDRAGLHALVQALLEEAPELSDLAELHLDLLEALAAELEPCDEDRVRGQLRRLLARADEPGAQRSVQLALEALLERSRERLAAGLIDEAQALAQAVLAELLVLPRGSAGEALAGRAAECLLACWAARAPADERRSEALRRLFDFEAWQIHRGAPLDPRALVATTLARQAVPAERSRLLEWCALAVRQAGRGPGLEAARARADWEAFRARFAQALPERARSKRAGSGPAPSPRPRSERAVAKRARDHARAPHKSGTRGTRGMR